MGPSYGNETGHWESAAISAFNDELLVAAGSSWDDCLPVYKGWYQSLHYDHFLERAKTLVANEYRDSPLYVLKDPRICRLVPFWKEVLAALGVKVSIILPIRNPKGVANSLFRRDETPEWFGRLIWLRHVVDAEFSTRGESRVFTGFSDLFEDWQIQIDKIAQALGISFPRVSSISAQEIDDFLLPKGELGGASRNSKSSQTKQEWTIDGWVSEAFEIFENWIRNGEQPDDYEALDRIKWEFDHASSALGRALLPSHVSGEYGQGVRRRQKNTDISSEGSTSQMAEQALDDAKRQEDNKQVMLLRAQLEENIALINELRESVQAKDQALIDSGSALQNANAQLSVVEHEVVRSTGELQQNASIIADLQLRIESLHSRIAEEEGATAQAREELARRVAASDESNACLEALSQQVQSGQLLLQERSFEVDRLMSILTESNGEVDALRAQLGQKDQDLEKLRNEVEQVRSLVICETEKYSQLLDELEFSQNCLRQQDEENHQYRTEISELKLKLEETGKLAERLHDETAWVFKLAAERKTLQDQVATQATELARFKKTVASLQREVSNREIEISSLAARNEIDRKFYFDKISEAQDEKSEALQELAKLNASLNKQRIKGHLEKARADERLLEIVRLTDMLSDQACQVNQAHKNQNGEFANFDMVRAEISILHESLEEARKGLAASEHEKRELQEVIDRRFNELAKVSQLLLDSRTELGEKTWFQELSSALIRPNPIWWSIMPRQWRLRQRNKKLRQLGLFDCSAYLRRYPDVAAEGVDPLRHYLSHGLGEGRTRAFD